MHGHRATNDVKMGCSIHDRGLRFGRTFDVARHLMSVFFSSALSWHVLTDELVLCCFASEVGTIS